MVRDEFYPQVGMREWNEKVEGALRAVGLNPPDVLNKFPHQLSGGQLQRFLVARALLLDIRLLIADEIISMLDASTRVDVLNLLADLKARGLSILFITHDLSLGYYISDRAVILYRGRIAEMGPTEKVYHRPLHPYTEMLMESVPRLDRKWEEEVRMEREGGLVGLTGDGCVYAARCPKVIDICTREEPELKEADAGHFVACWAK
jgi:peptide/nickel transport system ATP-binding protein